MKQSIEDLKIFGGEPSFAKPLHVGRPNVGDKKRLHEFLDEILERNWLTNGGPLETEFEARIAEMTGTDYCVATCNGTIALELAIRALDLNGEVIVPSFTFVATAHALQWQEITPVFADIRKDEFTIDPESVKSLITPRTTGIIGVNLWGRCCDVTSLTEIARDNGLKLMFDSSHALACTYRGRNIGSFGDAEVFSFHATKFLNTFEGGAITTNNADLADKMRLMRNFGFVSTDKVDYVGTNGKMTEIAAAMGLTNLDSIDEFIAHNYANYLAYEGALEDLKGVRLEKYDRREKNNYQYIVLEIDPDICKISRNAIMEIMTAEKVLARRYFYPGCHNMEPYRSYYPHSKLLLPVTEAKMQNTLALPSGMATSSQDVARICELLRFIVTNGETITERLLNDSSVADARKAEFRVSK